MVERVRATQYQNPRGQKEPHTPDDPMASATASPLSLTCHTHTRNFHDNSYTGTLSWNNNINNNADNNRT